MGEGEKESWNMANATLQRFDILLKQSSFYAQTGQLLLWKNCLMDIRRNLYPFMSSTQFKECTDKLNELPSGWAGYDGVINKTLYPKVNKIFDDVFMLFIDIMKKKGLLMPKTIDSTKAVIEM